MAYRNSKWLLRLGNPIPAREDGREPAVAGYHGHDAEQVTEEQRQEWLTKYADRATLISPHYPYIILDIDQHGDKHGFINLANALGITPKELAQRLEGNVHTSARPNKGHGHFFFTMPEPIPASMRLKRHIVKDVDTIDHRYYVVAPNEVHASTGEKYQPGFFDLGKPADREMIRSSGSFIESIKPCPKWLWDLLLEPAKTRPTGGDVDSAEELAVDPWGEPDKAVQAVLDAYLDEPDADGSHHTTAQNVQLKFAMLAENGQSGVWTAMEQARACYDVYRPGDWDHLMENVTFDMDRTEYPEPARIPLPDALVAKRAGGGAVPKVKPYSVRIGIEPYAFAREMLDRHFRDENGTLTLRYHDDRQFWLWDERQRRYKVLTADEVTALIERKLRGARDTGPDGMLDDVRLKPKNVADVLAALRSECLVSSTVGTSMLSAVGGVPFRNGWLNVYTHELESSGPERDVRWVVPLNYRKGAKDPVEWFRFLDSLGWREGSKERALLQEWFGYLLSGSKRQQKMMLLLGPKRAGKGTILDVAAAMFGDGAVGTQLDTLMGEFGLQNILGAGLVTVGDARFGFKTDKAVNAKLLSLAADDTMTVNVKNSKPLSVKLPGRLMIATNEPPNFLEASDALASRFVILQFVESFYGREDLDLKSKILAELDGIVEWSLAGLKRLDRQGFFTETDAGREIQEDMILDSAPVRRFVEERCEVSDAARVPNTELYQEYVGWCEQFGYFKLNESHFGKDLLTAYPGKIRNGNMKIGTKNLRAKYGIKVKA